MKDGEIKAIRLREIEKRTRTRKKVKRIRDRSVPAIVECKGPNGKQELKWKWGYNRHKKEQIEGISSYTMRVKVRMVLEGKGREPVRWHGLHTHSLLLKTF